MPLTTLLVVLVVGAATGFLGGLFGKGGSALATPVLAALGIPAIVAVASPLPATIPGTLLAARQYGRRGHIDRRVLWWSVAVGLPATLVGAALTRWIEAEALVVATDVLVAGLGVSILVGARRARSAGTRAELADGGPPVEVRTAGPSDPAGATPGGPGGVRRHATVEQDATAAQGTAVGLTDDGAGGGGALATGRSGGAAPAREALGAAAAPPVRSVVAVALAVGLVAGLLANSGGFLLAPLYLVALRLPVRPALGTSLAVSAALAVPGTVAHAALGHIDWGLVLAFAAASVPLAAVGARTALRVHPERLEVVFGAMLVVLATVLLTWG
ncbi:MAG TPA: sulfite exporter TauE/SafE family protein [Iamia sp.]|nr:sulfite exporter TauE/SafE family protein [Iamia sp.]